MTLAIIYLFVFLSILFIGRRMMAEMDIIHINNELVLLSELDKFQHRSPLWRWSMFYTLGGSHRMRVYGTLFFWKAEPRKCFSTLIFLDPDQDESVWLGMKGSRDE